MNVYGDTLDETDENFFVELVNPVAATLSGGVQALRAAAVILDDDGLGSNLALTVSNPVVVEGNSGQQNAHFEVSLSRPQASAISIPYQTVNGTANTSDYVPVSGTLTFAPGQTTAGVNVAVLGDTAPELAESFSLLLSPPASVASGVNGAVGMATILDDDAAAGSLPSISISSPQKTELNSSYDGMSFVVTLSAPAPSGGVNLGYHTLSGTAQEGVDYYGTSGTLRFAAGQTSAVINVNVIGDTVDEVDENFFVELTNPVGGVLSGNAPVLRGMGTILDDDGLGSNTALLLSAPVVVEGNGTQVAHVEATLSRPANSTVSIPYQTVNGTAVAGQDYTATSGTLTFLPGQMQAAIDVTILGDTVPEPAESFSVVLAPPPSIASGANGASAQVTILDDDAAAGSLPSISISSPQKTELNSSYDGMSFVVTLSAPAPSGGVNLGYHTLSGTAQEGVDYYGTSGTLRFAAGQTSAVINVNVIGDTVDEVDENFFVELTNPVGGVLSGNAPVLRGMGTILDDDGLGSNTALLLSAPVVVEGNGTQVAHVEATLSRPANSTVSIPYQTVNGTAVAGQDYTATSGTLTFLPGQMQAAIDVTILGDTVPEPAESFSVVLAPPPSIASGANGASAQVTILDDDAAAGSLPSISISSPQKTELNSSSDGMSFVVTLSAPAPSGGVTVAYRTVPGTAAADVDYYQTSGTLRFAAGQTSAVINVNVIGDTVDEVDETFSVELTNPSGAVLSGGVPTLRGIGTILDDDGLGSNLALSVTSPVVLEGNYGITPAHVEATLSRASATLVTVAYSTVDGSALAGSDYQRGSGTLVFLPGQLTASVDVGVIGDPYTEPNEDLTVRFSDASGNSRFAPVSGTVTIINDDTGTIKPSTDPLFDTAYYLAKNPDVAAAGVDPYQHYLVSGYKEGRDPNPYFSSSYYLSHNPDVAAAGVNPLLHFEANGYKEARNPSAGFSLSDYWAAYPDVQAAGINPLLHYVANGRVEGRSAFAVGPAPEPGFNSAYYYAQNPDVRAAGLDAYSHYATSGYKEGRNPDALFDARYYLAQNPDVAAAGVDPLAHFDANGFRDGREPSLLFSDAKYLAAYPDVAAVGVNPLLHYLSSGQAEGRMAFLPGAAAAADPLVNAPYYDKQLGATLIPSGTAGAQQAAASYDATGWKHGLNPDALFDTNYYLSHNPDVAAAGINPLAHYEVNGWKEGRNPSAAFSTSKYLAAYADVNAAGVNPLLHYVVSGQAEGRSAFST